MSSVSFAFERVKTILNHLGKEYFLLYGNYFDYLLIRFNYFHTFLSESPLGKDAKDMLNAVEAEWGPVVNNIAVFSERCHSCARLYDNDVEKYKKKAMADKKIAPVFKKAVNEYLSDFNDMVTHLEVYTTPLTNNFLAPIINKDDASEIFKYLQNSYSDLMEIFQHVHTQSDILVEHSRCQYSNKFESDLQYVMKNKKLRPKTQCSH